MKKLSLLALALLPALALADTGSELKRIDNQLDACLADKDNMSTMGMKFCANQALEKADELLNSNYKLLVSSLSYEGVDEYAAKDNAEILKRLKKSQRAWIPARDADCSLVATSSLGGSAEGLEQLGCLYGKTVERVKFLEESVSAR